MAPLSYYWLISFIYLVIAKREISAFGSGEMLEKN
jgi:hypothetical protein